MRCVVTGAAGFVGSSLCDELLRQGHEVVGIDCFVDYYPKEIKLRNIEDARSKNNFTLVEADLNSLPLEEVLEGAELIFHQAAQAGVRASWGKEFSVYTDCNISATQRLLEAAKCESVRTTLKKIVYASSSSVYGDAETLPTVETLRPAPVSPYGVSKLAAEHLSVLYYKEFDVPTISLRYFTVYGPRQRPDMAFNRFIHSALKGEPVRIFDDGEQSRDFSFISDIVSANLKAALCKARGGVYNIGGGSRVTINQVIKILEDVIGSAVEVQYLARERGDVKHTAADTSLAKRDFDYLPSVDLTLGLESEVSWIQKSLSG